MKINLKKRVQKWRLCINAVFSLYQPPDANESDSDDDIYQENSKTGNGYELIILCIESGMDKSR